MVGYSLLTLAVSIFGCEKRAPRKFDLEKWWTWRVKIFMGRSIKLRGCTPLKSNIDTQKWPYFKGVHLFPIHRLGIFWDFFGIYVSFFGVVPLYLVFFHPWLNSGKTFAARSVSFGAPRDKKCLARSLLKARFVFEKNGRNQQPSLS